MNSLYNFTYEELKDVLTKINLEPLRVTQTIQGLYNSRALCFKDISTLDKKTKNILEEQFVMTTLTPIKTLKSSDGSIKILYSLSDGEKIETVLIPNTKNNYTLCVSSQAGCPMRCLFCASGKNFKRNLKTHEIVEQVVLPSKNGFKITNIVFMGTGEPLLNIKDVLKSIQIINHEKLLKIGARQITVSTSGIPDGILSLSDFPLQIRLAVSLHFFKQEEREKWIKGASSYNLNTIIDALKTYQKKTNRQITIEHILIKKHTDNFQCMDDMRKLLSGLKYHVNLILWNPVEGYPFKPSDLSQVYRILKYLKHKKISVTLRKSHGIDIKAACGQLRAQNF